MIGEYNFNCLSFSIDCIRFHNFISIVCILCTATVHRLHCLLIRFRGVCRSRWKSCNRKIISPRSKLLHCIHVPRQESVDTIHSVVVIWQLLQRFMNVPPYYVYFIVTRKKFVLSSLKHYLNVWIKFYVRLTDLFCWQKFGLISS